MRIISLKDPSGGQDLEVPCSVHIGSNPHVPEAVQIVLQDVASSDDVVDYETKVVSLQLVVGLVIAVFFRSPRDALIGVLAISIVIALITRLLQWALRKKAFEAVWQYHQRLERQRNLCPVVGKVLLLPVSPNVPKRVVLDYGDRAVQIDGEDAACWAAYVGSLPDKEVRTVEQRAAGWYWHDAGMLCTVKRIDPPRDPETLQ